MDVYLYRNNLDEHKEMYSLPTPLPDRTRRMRRRNGPKLSTGEKEFGNSMKLVLTLRAHKSSSYRPSVYTVQSPYVATEIMQCYINSYLGQTDQGGVLCPFLPEVGAGAGQ